MKARVVSIVAQGLLLTLFIGALLYRFERGMGAACAVGKSQVTVRGRVLDGRFPDAGGQARGIAATVQAYEYRIRSDGCAAGKAEPTRLLGQTRADARGAFILSVAPPGVTVKTLWIQALQAGLVPLGRVVPLEAEGSDVKLYLAPTAVTGALVGADDQPAATDLWLLRQEPSGRFQPEEIAGGRPLKLPMGVHHTRFGLDTDTAGNFAIPISRPGVQYQLLVAVDTNTDRFDSFVTAPFLVRPNELTTLCSIHLSAPLRSPGGGRDAAASLPGHRGVLPGAFPVPVKSSLRIH